MKKPAIAITVSKVIVTGDRTQKDLPRDQVSGLDVAMKVLKNVEDISFVFLDNNDVVRHPLVQKIVKAYEEYDKKMSNRNSNRKRSNFETYFWDRNISTFFSTVANIFPLIIAKTN